MALRAVECAVTAGEWETGWMDKRGAFPRRCRVALCAVLREAGRFVIRICDLLIVVQMAVHAVRLQRADTSFMTHRTRDCRVTARKREARRMLERRTIPGRGRVALRAIRWEPGCCVVRICR